MYRNINTVHKLLRSNIVIAIEIMADLCSPTLCRAVNLPWYEICELYCSVLHALDTSFEISANKVLPHKERIVDKQLIKNQILNQSIKSKYMIQAKYTTLFVKTTRIWIKIVHHHFLYTITFNSSVKRAMNLKNFLRFIVHRAVFYLHLLFSMLSYSLLSSTVWCYKSVTIKVIFFSDKDSSCSRLSSWVKSFNIMDLVISKRCFYTHP